MEVTVVSIISIVTAVVTYIFGFLVKKFNILEKNYIPLQNLVIGIVAGVVCSVLNIEGMDMTTALIVCLTSALGAGGAYDLTKTKGGN
ncbi:MAG: hypothetical protein IKK84_00130 [Clostridia bacterium]|nr:hypothetical protein [Clostridia bacterium]